MSIRERPMLLICFLTALTVAPACNRGEDAVATAEKESASQVQSPNQTVTVVGCLRAGEASETFVLTTPRSTTGDPAATYQLVGADEVNLRDHIGRQVEVSGILSTQQRLSTRSTTDPAPNPTGTAGTPEVSTTTQLDIKRLDVQRVRAVGDECAV